MNIKKKMPCKSFLLTFLFLLTAAFNAAAAEKCTARLTVRYDFADRSEVSAKWRLQGLIPGVRPTRFTVEDEPTAECGKVLAVTTDSSTGVFLTILKGVDITRMPYVRWRWRVTKPLVPRCDTELDDQPVVIYFGDGSVLEKRSVAYRWEHFTPRHTVCKRQYGGGTVNVMCICVRNRETECGKWFIEERNVLADFKKAFGSLPGKRFALSIGANSQYNASSSRAEIDFIEFSSQPFSGGGPSK